MKTIRTLSVVVLLALLALLGSLGAAAIAEPQGSNATAEAAANHKAAKSTKARAGAAANGAIMRGADNVALVGRLPWWRSDRMQTIQYLDKTVASQVLTAADAWLGLEPDGIQEAIEDAGFGISSGAAAPYRDRYVVVRPQMMASDESVGIGSGNDEVAMPDPNEANALDLAATASDPAPPADNSWLKGLLALLGGAVAAVSTARFLFV